MVMTALGIVVMTALGRRNRIFVGCRNLEQYLVVVMVLCVSLCFSMILWFFGSKKC